MRTQYTITLRITRKINVLQNIKFQNTEYNIKYVVYKQVGRH